MNVKAVRDVLIILVLGGIVIAFALHFFGSVHEANVQSDSTVIDAEVQCTVDGRTCNFTSIEDAQAYLNSSEHLEAVKKRELEDKARQESSRERQAKTRD